MVTVLTDRRRHAPYGLDGGAPGATEEVPLPPKVTLRTEPGGVLRIATPGGGGWGKPMEQRWGTLFCKEGFPKPFPENCHTTEGARGL